VSTPVNYQELAMRHTPLELGATVQGIREALQGEPSISPSINVLLAYVESLELAIEKRRGEPTPPPPPNREALVEALADAEHASWSHWMDYLFEQCRPRPEGGLIIPPELVSRWMRQAATPYSALSEPEKESDRQEVRKILPIIELYLAAMMVKPLTEAFPLPPQGWQKLLDERGQTP
jgi:hypothetical protein